jgi:hypothetical protein
MPGFMALLAALVLLEVGARAHTAAGPGAALSTAAGMAVAVLVCGQAMAWLVCGWSRRQGATVGLRRVLIGWDLVAQVAITAAFGWMCLEQGWVQVTDSYTIGILPWIGMVCVHWFALAGGLRALGDSWCRAGFVWQQVRLGVLPLLLLMPLLDLGPWLVGVLGLEGWFSGAIGDVLNILGGLAAAAALVVLAPGLLVRLWGARPLPPGPGRDLVGQA